MVLVATQRSPTFHRDCVSEGTVDLLGLEHLDFEFRIYSALVVLVLGFGVCELGL